MIWSRKPSQASPLLAGRRHVVGLDVTSSRALAVSLGQGRPRKLLLDDPAEALAFTINLERRSPDVGRAGAAIVRKLPHLVCSNFLPALGHTREWRSGRLVLTPESALRLAFEKIRPAIESESESLALALPAYLTTAQVEKAIDAAHRADLPLEGTVCAPLALVADRAAGVLAKVVDEAESDEPVVMPLRPLKAGAGTVIVLDADEFALTGSVLEVEPEQVRLLASTSWPRLGLKAWMDRLLDSVADRCVRLCRRDPRDSAEAEQALFDQFDAALDRHQAGQRVTLTVRTASWYQDVVQVAGDFEGYCASLAERASEDVRALSAASSAQPPRAILLTHAAARLPGLFAAVHATSAECTAVESLPPPAVALAVARLVPRWLNGELPRTHLDSVLPLAVQDHSSEASPPRSASRSSTRG